MPLMHLVVLAVVQGITEFLPISSSAHLALVPHVTGWQDQGQTLDIAVHVGTLVAVLAWAWRDIWRMLSGIARALGGRRNDGADLAYYVIVASIPVVLAGLGLKLADATDIFRNLEVIGWATVGFGLLLWGADAVGMTIRRLDHMSTGSAILIGLIQVTALIPGASRSGVTMTAGRLLGFERAEAARFSLLLGIPAIAGAGVLEGMDLWQSGNLALGIDAAIAAGLAFVSALLAIALMMSWLRRASFLPFVLYRLALGGLILWWVYA